MSGAASRSRLRRYHVLFASLLFISLGVACVVGFVIIVVQGVDEDTVFPPLYSSLIGMLYAVLGLANIQTIGKGFLPKAGWAAISALTAAAAVWVCFFLAGKAFWNSEPGAGVARVAGTLSILGVAASLALCVAALPRRSFVMRLLIAAEAISICALGLTGVMLSWTTWWYRYNEIVGGGFYIWFLLTLAGMFAVVGVARLQGGRRTPKETIPSKMSIEMTCPRCGAEQVLPMGVTACGACRFALVIEIEEPRCECGYLLYRLAGETCPECGRVIPVTERWGSAAATDSGLEGPRGGSLPVP